MRFIFFITIAATIALLTACSGATAPTPTPIGGHVAAPRLAALGSHFCRLPANFPSHPEPAS